MGSRKEEQAECESGQTRVHPATMSYLFGGQRVMCHHDGNVVLASSVQRLIQQSPTVLLGFA